MLAWILGALVAAPVVVVVMALRNQDRDPMPHPPGRPKEGASDFMAVAGPLNVKPSAGDREETRCTLYVQDPETSSQHAEVRLDGDCARVIDLGSNDGTFVNGKPLHPNEPCPLTDGDRIKAGGTIIVFKAKASNLA